MREYPLSGSYPKWQVHTVEIDLQYDEYRGVLRWKTGGNCLGASILWSAISEIEDRNYEPNDDVSRKHCILDEDGCLVGFRLYNDQGDELILEDGNDDLEDCIVGVRIVAVKPEDAG